MSEVTYKVQGMSCHGCERSVELAITALPGAELVVADAAKGTVTAHFKDNPPPIETVKKAVDASGYKFVA